MNLFVATLTVISIIYRCQGQVNPANTTKCLSGSSTWYRGTRNYTYTGIACQYWNATYPHKPRRTPRDGTNHNYCRNPDNEHQGTWCYTMNKNIRWQLCKLPKCPDDSLLIMTSWNSSGESLVYYIPADPELAFPKFYNESPIYRRKEKTYVWSVAADKQGERVFFSDYRANFIGIFSFVTNVTTQVMQGLVNGVEEMAYDWVSQNLYWADSDRYCIIVAEKNFKYFTEINRNTSEIPFGVALHAKQRLLFVSGRSGTRSYIKVSDLAGKNSRYLFENLQLTDVRSLAIDYTDDKLFWANNAQRGSFIMSSSLDGSNVTNHYRFSSARIWGIAAYLDSIFLADQTRYSDRSSNYFYYLRIMPKTSRYPSSVRSKIRLKSLAVYSKNEEYSIDKIPSQGECAGVPPCDQICLPRINATRECACAFGYHLSGNTTCIPNLMTDNFLVTYDSTLKNYYQISLGSKGTQNFSVVPIATNNNPDVTAIALNHVTNTLYWFDRSNISIFKYNWNGSNPTRILQGYHVKSMAVDPVTGNVYFVDRDTQFINVMNADGQYLSSILKPLEYNKAVTIIQSMCLDIFNKYVYWTDYNNTKFTGTLLRTPFDGSNIEVIKTGLSNAVITTSNQRRTMILIDDSDDLYEFPLSSLKPDNLTIQNVSQATNLNGVIGEILDLKSDNEMLYFTTDPTDGVSRLNLSSTEDFVLTHTFTEKLFFPRSLEIYRSSNQNKTGNSSNLCVNRSSPCAHLCLYSTRNTTVCACQNGFNVSGSSCVNASTIDDQPPSYGNTCPADRQVDMLYCETRKWLQIPAPKWTDDRTASKDIKIGPPTVTNNRQLGMHTFTYTATDLAGNVGYCSFNIAIQRVLCPFPLNAPPRLNVSSATCRNENLVYNITCKDPNLVVRYGNRTYPIFTNRCQLNYAYVVTNYSELSCEAPATSSTVSSSATSTKTNTSPFATTKSPTATKPISTATSSQTTKPTTNAIVTTIPTTVSATTSSTTSIATTTKPKTTTNIVATNSPSTTKITTSAPQTTTAAVTITTTTTKTATTIAITTSQPTTAPITQSRTIPKPTTATTPPTTTALTTQATTTKPATTSSTTAATTSATTTSTTKPTTTTTTTTKPTTTQSTTIKTTTSTTRPIAIIGPSTIKQPINRGSQLTVGAKAAIGVLAVIAALLTVALIISLYRNRKGQLSLDARRQTLDLFPMSWKEDSGRDNIYHKL